MLSPEEKRAFKLSFYVVAVVVSIVGIIVGICAAVISTKNPVVGEANYVVSSAEPPAKFNAGDIVYTVVGGYQAQILGVWCSKGLCIEVDNKSVKYKVRLLRPHGPGEGTHVFAEALMFEFELRR
jgi:hypothetical protein